jgi:hypothetical protein
VLLPNWSRLGRWEERILNRSDWDGEKKVITEFGPARGGWEERIFDRSDWDGERVRRLECVDYGETLR